MGIFKKIIQRATMRALNNLVSDEKLRFLRNNYLFNDLSDEAFLFIGKKIIERRYCKDELIFKQENPGVCLFIVKQGTVEIYLRSGEKKSVYATLKEGSLFGEISVISKTYRTASAKALENDTVLLTISSFDLNDMEKLYPKEGLKVLKAITETIVDNLVETSKRFQEAQIEIDELKAKLEK